MAEYLKADLGKRFTSGSYFSSSLINRTGIFGAPAKRGLELVQGNNSYTAGIKWSQLLPSIWRNTQQRLQLPACCATTVLKRRGNALAGLSRFRRLCSGTEESNGLHLHH